MHTHCPNLTLFICPHCDKKCMDESLLRFHVEFIHRQMYTDDAACRARRGQNVVGEPYRAHKNRIESLSCQASCHEYGQFLVKNSLVEHLRRHIGQRPFKCRHCRMASLSAVLVGVTCWGISPDSKSPANVAVNTSRMARPIKFTWKGTETVTLAYIAPAPVVTVSSTR